MENPDHYKYMPKPHGEQPHGEEMQNEEPLSEEILVEESVVIVEEQPVPPARTAETGAETAENSDTEVAGVSDSAVLAGKSVLKFFYDFFNPFIIPTYATLLIFELSILKLIAPGAALPYTLTVFGITCVFPLLALLILKRIGSISQLGLPLRSDRTFPYIIEFLAFVAATLFFAFKGGAPWLWLTYCGAGVTVMLNFALNFKWKVSNHCSAMAAMLAVLIVINRDGMPHYGMEWWAIATVIIAGLQGTGAIVLGGHSLRDVFLGYATGFLPTLLLTLIK